MEDLKTEYKKLKDGKVEFKYTQGNIDFKSNDNVIGYTTHIQTTIINSKDKALEFLNTQFESVKDTVMKLQTESDKNDFNTSLFTDISKYIETNKKVPLKKLTRLNELYKKYETKKKLDKELELYKKQHDKIAEQVKEVEKL